MTNRSALDIQQVNETEAALAIFANKLLFQLRKELHEKAARIPRDLLFAIPDDLADGPYADLRYTLFRPHYVTGVAVSSATATTGTCTIDVQTSVNGGATWATIFSTPPTIASGKLAGAAIVNVNIASGVGGVTGVLSVTMLAAGTMIRTVKTTGGGATGLIVQLGLETRVDLDRVHLPTTAGQTPLGGP